MKKYLFSILTLLLVFPIMVNAETYKAKIGETNYETIEDAITAATDGATIVLLEDSHDITVTEGKKVTIDMGGFAIVEFVNNGETTLKNGNINYGIYGRAVKNTGTLVLDDIDITGHDSTNYAVNNSGTLTVKNSTFTPEEGEYAQFLYNAEGAKVTVENGTYLAHDMFKNYGEFIINGGTYTITSNNVANYTYGKMTVNNGTFNAERNTNITNIRGHLVVNGGTFNGQNGVENYDPSYVNNTGEYTSVIDIYGGSFNVTELAFHNTSFSNYSTINFYDGVVKSTTADYVVGGYGAEENVINILGGTITANNAKGIFLQGDNLLTIGKDDGTVNANSPYIDIRKGYIHTLGNTEVNFYDGVLNIDKERLFEGTITTLKTPTKYSVKYDKNEDNSYKAYLEKEVDKYWEKFVEAFKTNEYAKELLGEDSGITVTHTDNSLTVTMVDTEENKTYVTKFTYDSETGIVTYVPIEEVTVDNMADAFMDSIWILNTIYAISDVKGYDAEKVLDWLDTVKNPTIAKDGIEYTSKEFSYNEEGEGVSVSGTIEYFTSYELDIINGLKTFNNTSKPITNPSTGISFPIIFVLIALVFGFGVYLIRNKKYFSRG